MGFFSKKPKKGDDGGQDEVRGAVAPDPRDAKAAAAADKARIKKIRAVKKKFDETVWATALDTMRSSIPQFTIIEPDPDVPGGEIPRYVVLGFDLNIVDYFSNKSDDDIGSILSAIKHSMDVIIEDRLFDNSLILIIPTAKSLAALAEFEETFDLKFFVCYVTEDDVVSLETKTAEQEDDFIFITLPEIREMLAKSVSIKDQIHQLQIRVGTDGDYGGLSGEETTETRAGAAAAGSGDGDGEVISEEEYERDHGGEGEPAPEEPVGQGGDPGKADAMKGAVDGAVEKAAQVARNLSNTSDEAKAAEAKAAQQPAPQGQPAQPQGQPAPEAPGQAAGGARARINRIRNAAQQAVTQARQDPQIQQRQQAIQAPQQQTFDTAAMDKYIARKYYSDDLELEISSQPFDAMFLQSNPYMPFQEVPSDGWLDGYVNSLRRDANARLAKLHYENLLLMRQRYMEIITKHCEEIVKAVATDDKESRFGFLKAQFEAKKAAAIEQLPAQIEAYKKQIEDEYQGRMKAEMENAANSARATFINRNAKEHARELKEIESELRANLESEFMSGQANITQQRRDEAKRQLDAGITEALSMCKDEYTKMMAMERQEYARLQAVIVDYMNEHMAADEAKIAVDIENQRRNTDIAKLKNDAAADMARAKADFEAQVSLIRAASEKSTMEHEAAMNEMKDRHAHAIAQMRAGFEETISHKDTEISLLKEQLEQSDARMDEMAKKFVDLDKATDDKYRSQIDMVKSEREAWQERAGHIERMHKYTDKVKLTGVIVGFAAALAVGIIIGCVIMAGSAQDAVDKQAQNAAAQQPEFHYFINGEEIDPDGLGQEGGPAQDGDAGQDDGRPSE